MSYINDLDIEFNIIWYQNRYQRGRISFPLWEKKQVETYRHLVPKWLITIPRESERLSVAVVNMPKYFYLQRTKELHT